MTPSWKAETQEPSTVEQKNPQNLDFAPSCKFQSQILFHLGHISPAAIKGAQKSLALFCVIFFSPRSLFGYTNFVRS